MMKRLPLLMLLAALGCAFAACTLVPLDLSKPADVARLYRMRCSRCHSLIAPDEYAREDWPDILDEFGPRSNLKPEERAALEPWLLARARR